MNDVQKLLAIEFNNCIRSSDLSSAEEYRTGLLYLMAVQANPRMVANMDEAIKALERGNDPTEWYLEVEGAA